MKSDLSFGRRRWSDQLSYRLKDYGELLIVLLFQCIDFVRKSAVCIHETTEQHECAHNRDVHFDRALAASLRLVR